MNAPTWRALAALSVGILAATSTWTARARAEDPPPAATSGAAAGAASAPSDAGSVAASPVSATGLLPIFGVAVDFDGLSDKAKPDEAVASVQKLWDGYLKKAGFNVIHFPVDARELGDKGAARLAKLCAWAKTNEVRLAPALLGAAAGQSLPDDYPDKVGAFAAKTIELVGKAGDPSAYAQIMFYQLERPLNHPGHHGPMEPAKAAEILAAATTKLHAAEQAALAGSSLQATPVLAGVSVDYELIRVGAIANVPLSEENWTQAYAALHDYVAAVLGAAPVDVVGIEWYPGSFSADGVDRFPDLVGRVQTDFPGKLLLVSTGFSTAAGGEEDQSKYYTQTFNNLTDLRTNQGVESSFAGILWRTAMDKAGGEPSPPSSKTPEEMKSWNWTERAAELTRMWNEPGSESKEMRWWVGRVESRFGLIGATKDASKPGAPKAVHQLLSQLKNSLTSAAMATGAGEIAQELSSAGGPGGVKGVAGAVKDKLQAALFGMLDAWIAKTAQNLVSGGGDEGGSAPPPPPPPAPPALADLQVMGIGEVAEIKAGTLLPLAITVLNAGTAPATNVVLYLRDNASNDLGISAPTTISPGGSSVVNLPWTPAHPGNYPNVSLVAYCDNEGNAGDNNVALGDVPVSPAGGGSGGGGGGGGVKPGVGGIKYGGILGNVAIDPKSLGPVKGTLVTKTDPGFIHIEAVKGMTPAPMMMTMSGGAGGAAGSGGVVRMGGTTGGTSGGGTGGTASMAYSMQAAPGGLQPIALAFSVTNPFAHMFTSVKATLKISNKVVSTKDVGVLMPRQRRTVSFTQWTPPKSGTFPVQIQLAGLGPGGKPLNATANDQVVVAPAGKASPPPGGSTRSVIAARNGSTGGAPRAGGAQPMTIRSSASQTRLLTPLMAASAPQQASAPATRSLYLTPGGKRPLSGIGPSIFGLSANAIVVTPFPAQAGADVGVTVRLFNTERVEAKNVKVEVFVGSEKLGQATVDVPVTRAVIASGFSTWKAKPGRHEVRAVVTSGARSGSASKPIDIRPPHGVGAGGVASLVGRGAFTLSMTRLVMTTADIRLNPLAPAAGSAVDVSVRVQNPGAAVAKAVRVELFADGTRLGERTGDIPAGKDFVFTGFPKWTAASGKHTLLCRATASGQVTEATREVTAGATMAIVKPLLTTGATLQTAPSTTAPTTGIKTTAITGMTLNTLALRPDLQIGPADITFSPSAPAAGSALTISVHVRNVGTGAASGGSVRAILLADGAEKTRREFPVTIAAGGMTTLTWPVTTPSGGSLTVVATATIANDSRADNNQAQASATIQSIVLQRQISPMILEVQPK